MRTDVMMVVGLPLFWAQLGESYWNEVSWGFLVSLNVKGGPCGMEMVYWREKEGFSLFLILA